MLFSGQQDQALVAVQQWLDAKREPHFYLAGYAGSGKTTLAKHFAESVGTPVFGSYTGKAAQVMRSKGCVGATTIHRLIYNFGGKTFPGYDKMKEELQEAVEVRDLPTMHTLRIAMEEELRKSTDLTFSLADRSALAHADLLVLDECSMIPEEMAYDILSFNVPVLVLGDPAQLPPVKGAGFFTRQTPDFLLTEVHRQALDNPVLALATKVRKGERLSLGEYGQSKVVRVSKLDMEEAFLADIILTGKNKTRMRYNRWARKRIGLEGVYPKAGDKLICLTNLHKKFLYNGTTFVASADSVLDEVHVGFEDLIIPIELEDGMHRVVDACTECFDRYDDEEYADPRSKRTRIRKEIMDADYAYALTVHKSQGSQWDHVVIVDDGLGIRAWPPKPEFRKQFLYTAITRASERVTLGLSLRR